MKYVRATPRMLAEEIRAYLERCPRAMDTIEGITHWWLLEQRIIQAQEDVLKALKTLQSRRVVQTWQGPDGRVLYKAHPNFSGSARTDKND